MKAMFSGALVSLCLIVPVFARAAPAWRGYAGNAQHTAAAAIKGQKLQKHLWKMTIDLDPQYSGDELLIHYGSPMITASNTVLVPVKTGAVNGFRLEAHSGAT